MLKFNPTYELLVDTSDGGQLNINPNLTIEIDITRSTLSTSGVCQVRIFNQSRKNQNLVRYNASNRGTFREIIVSAGYRGYNTGVTSLPTIFVGNISQAWTTREGQDFITQIECYDGGFAMANGYSNVSFPALTPVQAVAERLVNDLPHVKAGQIGPLTGVIQRGNTYSGNTVHLLGQLTGGAFFIDNGMAHVLSENEFLEGNPYILDASSGLIGTPILEETILTFQMLFEPRLNCGSLIKVTSTIDDYYNGTYVVSGIKHRGMISPSVASSVITEVKCNFLKIV